MVIFICRQGHEPEPDTAQQCDIFGSRRQKQYFLYSAMINNARYGPKHITLLCIVEKNKFSSIVNIKCH